jgi:hypothetical protein
LEADDRTGVSSGAKIVKTSVRSSRLDTDEPWLVTPVGAGENVLDSDIVLYY